MSHTLQIVSAVATLVATLLLLGGCVYFCMKRSEDPARFLFKIVITLGIVGLALWLIKSFPPAIWPIIVLIPAIPVGLMWAPNVGAFLARPLTSMFDGGDQELEPAPLYSKAESKRQNGLYQEAILAIEAELQKFPGDFHGMMLLASIQAEDLKDLPAAQATLERLFEQPELPPAAAATALHSLADWQLRFAQDPAAARASLDRIVQGFPDTQMSHVAAQRIARMDLGDQATQSRVPLKFEVRAGERNIGLRQDVKAVEVTEDPEALAAGYVKQLETHPDDVETREKLAMLYAEHYQRLDLAIEQLEQLIAHPDEPPKHIAAWLNLEATLQIRFASNLPAAEEAVRRIIAKYPETALAGAAVTRLAFLDQELKGKELSRVKTLGVYEKNLGLKQAGPVKG